VVPLAISIPTSAVFATKSALPFIKLPVVNPTIDKILRTAGAIGSDTSEMIVPVIFKRLIPIIERITRTSRTIMITFLSLNTSYNLPIEPVLLDEGGILLV
jgi:hypothetical protein